MAKDICLVGKHRQHETYVISTHQLLAEVVSKTNPPEGFCLSADFQSGGRGQIGRNWHSEPGKNLLVSYVFYPRMLPVHEQFLLNVWVSLAVCSTVRSFGLQHVRIKWPNDVYIGTKKVAGILIQNTLQGQDIKNSIVSVGLNVNEKDFPADIPNPTSLAVETGQLFDREVVLSALHDFLQEEYRHMSAKQNHGEIRTRYAANLFGRQAWYLYRREDDSTFRGRVHEVTDEGYLVLENQTGGYEKYSFRQVSWVGE